MSSSPIHNAVILFDGVCNLCNSSVTFILDRDKHQYFKFGALQSEEGAALLNQTGLSADYLDSIVLIENGTLYKDSDAALRIARRLDGLWPVLYAGNIIPRFIRDAMYKWIAKNRYSWFGKLESCRLPTPDTQARFL